MILLVDEGDALLQAHTGKAVRRHIQAVWHMGRLFPHACEDSDSDGRTMACAALPAPSTDW